MFFFFFFRTPHHRELCYLKHPLPLTAAARAPRLCLTEPRFPRQVDHCWSLPMENAACLSRVCIPSTCTCKKPTVSPLDCKHSAWLIPWSTGRRQAVAGKYSETCNSIRSHSIPTAASIRDCHSFFTYKELSCALSKANTFREAAHSLICLMPDKITLSTSHTKYVFIQLSKWTLVLGSI